MFRDLDTLETRVEPNKENRLFLSISFFFPLPFWINSQQYGLNTQALV